MAQLIKIGKVFYSDLRMGGKRIKRALSSDRRIAEEKLAELVRLRGAMRHQHGLGDLSWELFRAKYKVYSKGAKKPHSAYYDELSLRNLEDAFPVQKLSQVTPELLEQLKYRLKAGGMNPNSINRRVYAVKAAMHKAEEWGYAPKRGWGKVKAIETTLARVDWFTIEELSQILQELKGLYKVAGFLGARCGLRLGEILFAWWEDIDWNLKRINISAKPGWNPKDYEKRFVPIPEDCLTLLRPLSKGQTGPVMGHQRYQSFSKMMSRHLHDIAGRGSSHTLRHTYASHLVQAGVPIYTVSKLLGHSSVETTERHYAHLAQSHLDDAAGRLPALKMGR